MQALRASQHCGQGLDCHPRDIVLGLLRGQRDACRLRMKPQSMGANVPGAKALRHQPVPDLAGCAEFPDLFKKIVVGIEEEAQPRSEIIDAQAPPKRPLHVLHPVVESEGQLLQRRRARLANVISADRDRD